MPQFYAVIVTGVLQRSEFRVNRTDSVGNIPRQVELKVPTSKAAGGAPRHTGLVNSIEAGDFSGEQRVLGELIAQRG